MAGQEVTFDDVARAAESLQEDGEAVTIEAVQDFLGEGSPNAVFKHLAAWRAANVKPATPPKAELPQELLAGLADWALKFAEQAGAGDREALARNEADIEALRSAGEALEAMSEKRFDVLISDIGMPQRDGYELVRAVRSLTPERGGSVPAIALTAFARSEDRARAMKAGFDTHLSKPVEPDHLCDVVARLAGR